MRHREATSRSGVFTAYVRSLGSHGEPPDRDAFDKVWEKLKSSLRWEIKRRGLWSSSPDLLGLTGWTHWQEDALEEAVAEAYTFNFVDRLRSLRAQARVRRDIDGLVIRNLRNFIHELQKKNDPLGYRVFEVVHAAVARAVGDGTLEVVEGSERIRNDTLLRLTDRAVRSNQVRDAEPDEVDGRIHLEARIAGWIDELMPELLTANGRRRRQVVATLARRLEELNLDGVRQLFFKDLVDTVKYEVRGRWAAIHLQEQGELVPNSEQEGLDRMVRLVRPREGFEERQAYRALSDCVSDGVDHLEDDRRTLNYLEDLWEYLRLAAASSEEIPSQRGLARLLGIPRDRLPQLFGLLQPIVERCRDEITAFGLLPARESEAGA